MALWGESEDEEIEKTCDSISREAILKSIQENNYDIEYISRFEKEVLAFHSKPDVHEYLKLNRSYSQQLTKVSFFGKNLEKNLGHMVGILRRAREIIEVGGKVHLIEATSQSGRRYIDDIDLVYSDSRGVILCDITYGEGLFSVSKREEKYATLDGKFPGSGCISEVWGMKVDLDPVEFILDDSKPEVFKQEFGDMKGWLDLCQDLTLDDVEDIMRSVAENNKAVKKIKLRSNPKCKGFYETDKVVNAVSTNGTESASVMAEFLSHASEKAKESYSLDYYDVLNKADCRWHVPTPFIANSSSVGPFDALREMLDLGCDDPLVECLYKCKESDAKLGDMTFKRVRVPMDEEQVYLDAIEVKLGGSGYKGWLDFLKSRHQKSQRPELNHVDLENRIIEIEDILSESVSMDPYVADIASLIGQSADNTKVGVFTKSILNKTLSLTGCSRLTDMMATISRVASAVSSGTKKYAHKWVQNHSGSVSGKSIILSLDRIIGKRGVTLSNLNSSVYDQRDKTVVVLGDLQDLEIPEIVRSHDRWSTKWFNISPTQLDWNVLVFHKYMSYSTMICDKNLVDNVCSNDVDMMKSIVVPSLYLTINSNKFSQASESIRYGFVNSTGISVGTRDMYKKLDWYLTKVRNTMERLFFLRMIKMTSLIELASENNGKASLSVHFSVNPVERLPTKMVKGHAWKVSFPHEKTYVLSDQNCFNSIYICKMLTTQRYTKVLSEAQVLRKELGNNEQFREIYDRSDEWQMKNQLIPQSKLELKMLLKTTVFEEGAGKYAPDFKTVMLSTLAGLRRSMNLSGTAGDTKIGEFVALNYNGEKRLLRSSVSDVANNKGSVSCNGKHSVIKTKKEIIGEGKDQKTRFIHQNSKGYRTILTNLYEYLTDSTKEETLTYDKLHKLVPDSVQAEDLSTDVFEMIKNSSTSLMPIVMFNLSRMRLCVAKMVHKDQIGPREIAVLNSVLRLNAYILEELARNIKDCDMGLGCRMNLIECRDKDEVIDEEYRKTKASGKAYIFDNADCSQWGPSMLIYVLCFNMSMRYTGCQRDLVIELSKQFSRKIFKLPDVFFEKFSDSYNDMSQNEFSKCCAELNRLSSTSYTIPCLNLDSQFLFSPQGMFQGVLGNMSSLYARDVLCFSDLMHSLILEVDVKSYDTSDDYIRFMLFDKSDDLHVYDLVAKSLWLHTLISNSSGILRNMYKSNFTEYMCEFNSIFRTNNGRFNPDIKSRLSYIDLSSDYDWSSTSLRCMNVSVEYLRNEGSVMGSTWVQIINTHLSLLTTGRLATFRRNPSTLFRLPLELGGLVRINPVRNSLEPLISNLKQNYDFSGKLDLESAFKVMLASTNRNAMDNIDMGEVKTQNVASISRSGLACLLSRYPRAKRAIEEYLLSIDEMDFLPMAYGGFKRNPIAVLMSCAQRESSISDHSSAATRYTVPQTPLEAEKYQINSQFLSILCGTEGKVRLSRHFILDYMTARYFDAKVTVSDSVTVNFVSLQCPEVRIDTTMINQHILNADRVMNSILPKGKTFKIMSVNKHVFNHRYQQVYSLEYNSVDMMVDELKVLNLPKLFGGTSDCSAYRYVMMESIVRNRYKNMMMVRGSFKMCLSEKDTNLSLMADIYISNFIEGGRLVCESSTPIMSDSDRVRSNMIRSQLSKPMDWKKLIDDSVDVDRHHMPLNGHGHCTRVDITNLVNELSNPRYFPDRAQRSQVYQELRAFENIVSRGRKNGIFVLDTDRVTFPSKTVYPKLLIARGVKYETFARSQDITHSVISIEKRMRSGEQVWEKYVTFIDDSLDEESIIKSLSTDGDKVTPIRLYESSLIHVSIRDFNGHYFVCMTDSSNLKTKLPMLYLCTATPISNKIIKLHPGESKGKMCDVFFGTRQQMTSLGMFDVKTKEEEIEEFYKIQEPDSESGCSVEDKDDIEMIDGVPMEMPMFSDSDDSDVSDGSDDEGSVVSSFYTARSSASYVHNFSSDTSLKFDKTRMVWLLSVPVVMDRMEFFPDEGRTALEVLIDYLDDGDASDSMWVRYCLKTSFLRSKDVNKYIDLF
jgi:hypothetical protein